MCPLSGSRRTGQLSLGCLRRPLLSHSRAQRGGNVEEPHGGVGRTLAGEELGLRTSTAN
jgi:hypothetical protein